MLLLAVLLPSLARLLQLSNANDLDVLSLRFEYSFEDLEARLTQVEVSFSQAKRVRANWGDDTAPITIETDGARSETTANPTPTGTVDDNRECTTLACAVVGSEGIALVTLLRPAIGLVFVLDTCAVVMLAFDATGLFFVLDTCAVVMLLLNATGLFVVLDTCTVVKVLAYDLDAILLSEF